MLPQSGALVTGELYTNSTNLAIKHITEAGGMRGNGQLVAVKEDSGATTQGAADAIEKMSTEKNIKLAMTITSSETIGIDAATKLPFGAGPTATAKKIPLICVGCSAPDFECIGLHQYVFGAVATGGDPTCAMNPTAGTIETTGYVYRMVETSIPQGAALAQMALADGASVIAGLAVNLPFGTALLNHPIAGVKKIVTDAAKTYSVTSVHEQSPAALAAKTMVASVTAQEFEAHIRTAYDNAIVDHAMGPVQALIVNSFPDYNKIIAAAAQANAKKPKLYFSFTGFSSELLATSGNALAGAKGTNYAIAGGPSPGTFVEDYAAIGNVPVEQVRGSIYVDTAYDAMVLAALAIYATGVESPSGEEVKAKLDTLNDPNGEAIGYKEFAKAK